MINKLLKCCDETCLEPEKIENLVISFGSLSLLWIKQFLIKVNDNIVWRGYLFQRNRLRNMQIYISLAYIYLSVSFYESSLWWLLTHLMITSGSCKAHLFRSHPSYKNLRYWKKLGISPSTNYLVVNSNYLNITFVDICVGCTFSIHIIQCVSFLQQF